jgi:hypothetical protein
MKIAKLGVSLFIFNTRSGYFHSRALIGTYAITSCWPTIRELGVNAYVVKPVDFHEFVNAIKELGIF